MSKVTTEQVEEMERNALIDALCNGSIELNNETLALYTGERVRAVLASVPCEDRAFHLQDHILAHEARFPGFPFDGPDNFIWLPCAEIEVQFTGTPEDYFKEPEEYHINGEYAYLYVGYGLTVPVDVEQLERDVAEWYQE